MTIRSEVSNVISRMRGGHAHVIGYTYNRVVSFLNDVYTVAQVKRAMKDMNHVITNGKGLFSIRGRKTPTRTYEKPMKSSEYRKMAYRSLKHRSVDKI